MINRRREEERKKKKQRNKDGKKQRNKETKKQRKKKEKENVSKAGIEYGILPFLTLWRCARTVFRPVPVFANSCPVREVKNTLPPAAATEAEASWAMCAMQRWQRS